MEIIFNPIIGKLRGTLGDLVFKQVNGKSYVARRPQPRSKNSYSGVQIARQWMFGINTKLAKCINQIDEYRGYWHKAANGKMSNCNAISKENYPIFGFNRLNCEPRLTPDSESLDFSEYGFCYDRGIITLECINENIGVVKDYKTEKFVMFAGVICVSGPKEHGIEEAGFFSIKSDAEKVTEGETTFLSLELFESQKQMIDKYKECMLYFGFISKDKDGNVINEVSTFTEDLKAEI